MSSRSLPGLVCFRQYVTWEIFIYDELGEITGLDRRTIQDYKTVSDRTSAGRHADLGFSHHRIITLYFFIFNRCNRCNSFKTIHVTVSRILFTFMWFSPVCSAILRSDKPELCKSIT